MKIYEYQMEGYLVVGLDSESKIRTELITTSLDLVEQLKEEFLDDDTIREVEVYDIIMDMDSDNYVVID